MKKDSETVAFIPNDEHLLISSEDIAKASEKHKWIQENTSQLFSRALYVAGSLAVTYSMRSNIYILYARTFYDDMTIISLTVYLSYLVSGIMSLSFGILGDRWRFDYLLIIAAMMDVITFFIEATATNFLVFALAYVIGGQPLESICQGWNIKLQPTYYAQQYATKYTQFWTIGYLIGPVIGGIIAYYLSYQSVFYIAAVLASILFLFCIIFFRNVEPPLLSQQLDVSLYYENVELSNYSTQEIERFQMTEDCKWMISNDFRFPISMKSNKIDDNLVQNLKTNLGSIGEYKIFLLFSMILCSSLVNGMESSFVVYYTTYMKDRFDCTVLESTLQICLVAFCTVMAAQTLKYVTKSVQNKQIIAGYSLRLDFKHYYIITIFVSLIILIVLTCVILPNNIFKLETNEQFIDEFWICMAVWGFTIGYVYIAVELIGIGLTPKEIGGSVIGIKIFCRYIGKATGCLIVGLLWDKISMECLWYTHACICVIVFLWILIICIIETLR